MRRQAQTLEGLEGFSNKKRVCLVRWDNTESMRSRRRVWMYGVRMERDFWTSDGERDSRSDWDRMVCLEVWMSRVVSVWR